MTPAWFERVQLLAIDDDLTPEQRQEIVRSLCLSPEEGRAALAELQPYSADRELELLGAVNTVVVGYKLQMAQTPWVNTVPPRKESIDQVRKINKTTKKLISLVSSHPYFGQRFVDHHGLQVYDIDGNWQHLPTALLELLAGVVRKTDEALNGRGHPVGKFNPRKSDARFWIWEQLFPVWQRAGRTVAYSEHGPLERLIKIVHMNCGLEAPSGPTLRQAITEWRKDHSQG